MKKVLMSFMIITFILMLGIGLIPACSKSVQTTVPYLTTTPTSLVSDAWIKEWLSDLNSTNITVKRAAIKSLGYSGNKTAVEPLLKFLDTKPLPVLRAETYIALGRIGDPRSENVVTEALANESQDFWTLWTDAVANSPPGPQIITDTAAIGRPVVPQLNEWLTNENPNVRELATKALEAINKK